MTASTNLEVGKPKTYLEIKANLALERSDFIRSFGFRAYAGEEYARHIELKGLSPYQAADEYVQVEVGTWILRSKICAWKALEQKWHDVMITALKDEVFAAEAGQVEAVSEGYKYVEDMAPILEVLHISGIEAQAFPALISAIRQP